MNSTIYKGEPLSPCVLRPALHYFKPTCCVPPFFALRTAYRLTTKLICSDVFILHKEKNYSLWPAKARS